MNKYAAFLLTLFCLQLSADELDYSSDELNYDQESIFEAEIGEREELSDEGAESLLISELGTDTDVSNSETDPSADMKCSTCKKKKEKK